MEIGTFGLWEISFRTQRTLLLLLTQAGIGASCIHFDQPV